MAGIFRTGSISSSPERTALRRRRQEPSYIEVLQQRAGNVNIKRLLIKGRCKRLNSLKSFIHIHLSYLGFPGGSDSIASACNVGDPGLIPGLGRFPGEGNGNLLWYSCLENPMDGGAWWAAVHGVVKSRTQLSN